MFEIFIALFGSLCIACRYIFDNPKNHETDVKIESWNMCKNAVEKCFAADTQTREQAKEYIRCGKHFEDICNTLHDDLQYALGIYWKSQLRIPNRYGRTEFAMLPDRHEYWIYHLLLAKQGKIDPFVLYSGYGIGGINSKNMCIRFAECIERELSIAGVQGIQLALELDYVCVGRRRTQDDLCGGNIKIASLCNYPTYRLW